MSERVCDEGWNAPVGDEYLVEMRLSRGRGGVCGEMRRQDGRDRVGGHLLTRRRGRESSVWGYGDGAGWVPRL